MIDGRGSMTNYVDMVLFGALSVSSAKNDAASLMRNFLQSPDPLAQPSLIQLVPALYVLLLVMTSGCLSIFPFPFYFY